MEKKTEIIAEIPHQNTTERCAPPSVEPAAPGAEGSPLPPAALPLACAASTPAPVSAAAGAAGAEGPMEDPMYGVERIERIGGGGFGEVWRVRYLGSEEAWKYIPIQPGIIERTGREAIHARRVNHRNVVRVLDVLRLEDHYVLRMELIRGRDFFRVVSEDGLIPPEEAVAYGIQIAQALAHAHSQDVVHLDLKPHNLILTEDGAKVMVTDFGISASLAMDCGRPLEAAGTPFFMAPEQFGSPPAVASSVDVWSLAVTLYWMMSLRYPFRFDERHPADVIRNDPPVPLCEEAPQVPPALWAIIARMLEKDPAHRPASMEEVVAGLEAFRRDAGDPAERGADRAYALCHFDEAIAGYDETVRRQGGPRNAASRAVVLARAVREARDDHEMQLHRVDERIACNDLGGALLAMGVLRRKYSRSAQLRERRENVEELIRQRFASPQRSLEAELRAARFDGARRFLGQLSSLLGVPGTRKILRSAAGEDAVLDGATIQRLRASVEVREALHGKLQSSVEEAVQAMDFVRARDALEEYQNQFPLPENLERMKTFAAAVEGLTSLADYSGEFLETVMAGGPCASEGHPLQLRKAASRCSDLLAAFDPGTYLRFAAIGSQQEEIQKAIGKVLERLEPEVEAVREARRKGDAGRIRRILETSGDLILHSDVFGEDVRNEIRDIRHDLDNMAQRSDRLYREGLEWLERRQFNKALTAFEEALRSGVGNHGDIGFLMRTCTEAAERRRRMAEDLHSLDLTISARAASLAEMAVYLQKAEELLALQEDQKQGETVTRAARALETALDLARKEADHKDRERPIDAARELSGALGGIKPEFLVAVVREARGIAGRLDGLVHSIIRSEDTRACAEGGSQDPAPGPTPEARLVNLHNIVDGLGLLRPLLAVPSVDNERHACEIIAGEIEAIAVGLLGSIGEGSADRMGREVLDLLESVAAIAPPEAADRIHSIRRRTQGKIRLRKAMARAAVIFSRAAQFLLPLAVALALSAVVVMAWFAGERREGAQTLRQALRTLQADSRWKEVDAMAVSPREDFALALRIIHQDLPAFGSLDGIADPEARFWARCVAGAGILSWISPDGTLVLGRTGIRRAIEETLVGDLEGTVSSWTACLREPFPAQDPGRPRAFTTLLQRLETAGRVIGGLGRTGAADPKADNLHLLGGRVDALACAARLFDELVGDARRLPEALGPLSVEAVSCGVSALQDRYAVVRRDAPSDGWKRLLDGEMTMVLGQGLRDRLLGDSQAHGGRVNTASVYEILRLIAAIRETGGLLAVDPAWSSQKDPLHPVFQPLVE